jgi:type II secretory pathway pseudopilin PulG
MTVTPVTFAGRQGLRRASLRSEQGLSLVEATIILIVLLLLTGIIAPSAGAYMNEARNVKAKADVETIGSALDLLLRNVGLPCVSKAPTAAATPTSTSPCAIANRIELLVSGSAINTNEPVVLSTASYATPGSTTATANANWAGGTNEVQDANKNVMDSHLVNNAAGYTAASFTSGGGPRNGIGWRGVYLNGPIDVDPWGYAYQANTLFFATANDAAAGTGEGQRSGGWSSEVVVISAGSNGVIQTPFGGTATATVGDDVLYAVQGTTQ